MATLSLCMIVRDEETMLPGCLQSVSGLVAEMIIVDTGSSDRTIQIAESYGAKVVHFPWRDDFSAARNESLRHANGTWVLVLDADERLQPECREELECLIGRDDLAAVSVWLKSEMPSGHTVEVIATRYYRLFRRLAGVEFTGKIHEQVLPSIQRAGGTLVDSEIIITHLGYAGSNPNKLLRNIRLLEGELEQRPDDPFLLLNVGHTLHGMGRLEQSTEMLRRALQCEAPSLDRGLQSFAWSRIADNYLLLNQPGEAVEAAETALVVDPCAVLPRYTLALACGRLQQYARALDAIRLLIFGPSDEAFRVQLRIDLLLEVAGGFLMQLGRPNEAALYYEEAIRHAESPQLYYLLGSALVLAGEFNEAEDAYEEAARRGHPMARERQALSRKLAEMREAVG